MPKFNYIAMDAQGKETKGSLDAKNQGEALARLQEMKLFPTKVVEAQQAAAAKGKGAKKGKAKAAKFGAVSVVADFARFGQIFSVGLWRRRADATSTG